jgi:hypothetical protein
MIYFSQIIDSKSLKYKGEYYHPHHFQCTSCQFVSILYFIRNSLFLLLFHRVELDENGREVRGALYCLPCHNKLDLPVCAACRRLIDDRVISALGKHWHVEVSFIADYKSILRIFIFLAFLLCSLCSTILWC